MGLKSKVCSIPVGIFEQDALTFHLLLNDMRVAKQSRDIVMVSEEDEVALHCLQAAECDETDHRVCKTATQSSKTIIAKGEAG
jgi:hypothetical protein